MDIEITLGDKDYRLSIQDAGSDAWQIVDATWLMEDGREMPITDVPFYARLGENFEYWEKINQAIWEAMSEN